jgi:hypothetical protein
MVVEPGAEFNFAYVIPGPGPTRLALPTALQMGWKNSPGYFCPATESTCQLAYSILKDSAAHKQLPPHPLEGKFLPAVLPEQALSQEEIISFLVRVYLDDFMKAAAVSRNNIEHLGWITRAVLHAIHAVFPPPEVTGHTGGKDSVSIKKLDKLDGLWHFIKELLGFECNGDARTVGITEDKALAYITLIEKALEAMFISGPTLKQISGKLQHLGLISPTMKGFMTPINRALATHERDKGTIGLGKKNDLRMVLRHCIFLIQQMRLRPTHIRELVSPHLPHIYGFTDSCGLGCGGALLPCTEWIPPTIWYLEYPPDIQKRLLHMMNQGGVTVNDGEMAAIIIQALVLELLKPLQYLSLCSYSDNKVSVGQQDKQATRADSPVPDRFLRAWATRRHSQAAGPADIPHIRAQRMTLRTLPRARFNWTQAHSSHDSLHSFHFPPSSAVGLLSVCHTR